MTTGAAPDIEQALLSTFGRLLEASGWLSQRLGRELEATTGLPLTWFEVLLRLSRSSDGQLSMGVLSQQLALTTGGMTRLVDRMIDAGYVERRPCPTDRRVVFVALAPAGELALQEAAVVHSTALRQVFAGFSPQDTDVLDELLDRLRHQALVPRS